MGRLIKFLVYILCLAFIALASYAYLGPMLGEDFSPPQEDVREPVTLDAN